MFVGVMSAVALGFVVIGVAEVSDQDEPRYWGNYTEGGVRLGSLSQYWSVGER